MNYDFYMYRKRDIDNSGGACVYVHARPFSSPSTSTSHIFRNCGQPSVYIRCCVYLQSPIIAKTPFSILLFNNHRHSTRTIFILPFINLKKTCSSLFFSLSLYITLTIETLTRSTSGTPAVRTPLL